MTAWLVVHLGAVGIWLGCVLTEIAVERALAGQGETTDRLLAGLHRHIDLLVELPAFVVVLVSGGLLLADGNFSPWLYAKIAAGLLAILANAVCLYWVLRRARAAACSDGAAFAAADHQQHRWGALVVAALLLTLLLAVIARG